MALYVTRPRRDEVRIGRGLPNACGYSESLFGVLASGITEQQVHPAIRYLVYNYPPISLHSPLFWGGMSQFRKIPNYTRYAYTKRSKDVRLQ